MHFRIKDGLGMEFAAYEGEIRPSLTLRDAYRNFVPHVLTSEIRTRVEYLILSDNIVVLD